MNLAKNWKNLCLGSVALLATVTLVACGTSTSSSKKSAGNADLNKKQTITLWSFTTMQPQIDELKKEKPNLTIKQVVVPYANFQTKLDSVLGTDKAPDMVALDAGFVEKYVQSGKLTNLGDYGVASAAKGNYQYTLDMGKDSKGKQVAVSYQAAPGAYYYNTNVFQKYLGIAPNDVASAQKALSSWDAIKNTGETIKEKSGGQAYLFSSLEEIYNPVIGARKDGWVIDNKLKIDSSMTDSLDLMKEAVSEGWCQNTTPQTPDWYGGISSNKIGAYAMPSWGLFYWLKNYAKDTAGAWRVTEGPVSYSWGGTWLAGVQGSKNADAASALAVYMGTNKEFQTWDVKTQNDFGSVKAINKEQGKDAKVSLIGGQNPYPVWSKVADTINGKNQTQYDQSIQSIWINDVVNPYATGKVTKSKALDTFKSDVKSAYPNIEVK